MMNKKSNIVFSILILLVFIIGCKKNPFDYRTKYIGDWDFSYSWSRWSPADSATLSGITYTQGSIEYGDGSEIKVIRDSSTPADYINFTVDREGNLSYGTGAFVGKFETKKKVYYSGSGGGLGSPLNYKVSGTKK